MRKFVLIEIHDIRKFTKYKKNSRWKQIPILSFFSEAYACFARNEILSFNDLIELFLQGDDDHRIGSMSIIAEMYPLELYAFLCNNIDFFSVQNLNFLISFVIPTYLPSTIYSDQIGSYCFEERLVDNVWVKILQIAQIHMR